MARTSHPETQPRPPHLDQRRSRPSVAIFGAGRLGSALARRLAEAGWQVDAWRRSRGGKRIPGVTFHTGATPPAVSSAKLLLLTVPDRAIGELSAELAEAGTIRKGQVVAHCSGALDLSPLSPLALAGASTGSLHPLVAAASGEVPLEGISAAIAGDEKAVRLLRRAARSVGLIPLTVTGPRPRYHAAASLAANGLVALADLASELLASTGMSREQALAALLPLMQSSVDNLGRVGLPDALTGPIARGDAAVVMAHLQGLVGDPAREAYRALAKRQIDIATDQGTGSEEGLEAIGRLLGRR